MANKIVLLENDSVVDHHIMVVVKQRIFWFEWWLSPALAAVQHAGIVRHAQFTLPKHNDEIFSGYIFPCLVRDFSGSFFEAFHVLMVHLLRLLSTKENFYSAVKTVSGVRALCLPYPLTTKSVLMFLSELIWEFKCELRKHALAFA